MGLGHFIAVIEDDASIRAALYRLFRKGGFEVSLFASAEDYLADESRDTIDCLVTDVCLPGLGGLELLERIGTGRTSRPAAVVITAHDDDLVRKRAVAAGAIGLFLKPFDNRQLQEAVRKAMGLSPSDE